MPRKVHLVKAIVFPVVMYGCESWTVKKAEHRRIDSFELWCWRRLLRVSWTARRSNQSILKEISPGISLEGMMLKLNSSILATSCEELTHWKRLWCWEGLGAGGEGDDRGWDGWMALPTQCTWVWVNSGSWWWTGRPGVLRFMGSQGVGHDWATELNWLGLLRKSVWISLHMNLGLLLENDDREEYVLDCGNSQEPLFLLPCLVINIRRPVKASVAWEGQDNQKLTLSWMKSDSFSHESNVDHLKSWPSV